MPVQFKYRQKAWAINLYKTHGRCEDCFTTHDLTFDHVRGKKAFTIGSQGRNKGWRELAREMGKCDLVCWACHKLRELKRGTQTTQWFWHAKSPFRRNRKRAKKVKVSRWFWS